MIDLRGDGVGRDGGSLRRARDGAVLALTPAVRDAVAEALEGRRAYGPTSAVASVVEVASPKPAGSGALVEVTLLTPEDQLAGRVSVPVRIEPVCNDRGPWIDDLRRRIDRLPAVVVTGEVSLRATVSLTAAAAAAPAPVR